MDDPIAIALVAAARSGAIGTIIHIGAGSGIFLQEYLASKAARIVLIEPNPELIAKLEEFATKDKRISVLACAIAATEGEAILHIYNVKSLSSLRAPKDLPALYPGLREVSSATVKTITLDRLLQDLPPADPSVGDFIIIDTPGEEATVVSALLARTDKERFAAILLSCGKTELYDGSKNIVALRARLQASGYRLEDTDQGDPDRPRILLLIDQTVSDTKKTKALLAEMTARLAEVKAKLAEVMKTLVERDAQLAEVLNDRSEQLALAESQKSKISSLELRIQELEHKQQIARNELRRSEGQIDLIKDLLLREDRL